MIIGGGIAGLMAAWTLSKQREVTLVETSSRPAATVASASMLAPGAEARLACRPLYEAGKESLTLWHELIEEIGGAPLESRGTLIVSEERDWIRSRADELRRLGEPFEEVSPRDLEPGLSESMRAALHIPGDRTLSLLLFEQRLRAALSERGVSFVQGRVIRIAQGWSIELEEEDSLSADWVVVAPGAWLREIDLPVEPPKVFPNQGVLIEASIGEMAPISHMIRTHDLYTCPKGDGTIRIGLGGDLRPGVGAVRQILERGWEVVPGLDRAHLREVRVGLRPDGLAHLPTVGPAGLSGLYWSVGYGRSGILLAPWGAKQIERMVL